MRISTLHDNIMLIPNKDLIICSQMLCLIIIERPLNAIAKAMYKIF